MKTKRKELYLRKDNPRIDESKEFVINARKYLGNKTNFIPLINQVIEENNLSFNSVMDLCMGTGVLSYHFAEIGKKVIANDLLLLNFVLGTAFMSAKKDFNFEKMKGVIKYCNNLNGIKGNFTKRFGSKFTLLKVSKKIDAIIKFLLNNYEINKYEKYYLVSSLMLAAEKSSEIDSDYLGKEKAKAQQPQLILKPLRVLSNGNVQVYNKDAIQLVKEKKADLAIIDPPFNEFDYSNYMVYPEQAVELTYPELAKPLKSDFCDKEKAPQAFKKLIRNLNAKYVMFWYSNDGIVAREFLKKNIKEKFGMAIIYEIVRKKSLHLVRNEPKTDFLILGIKNKKENVDYNSV